MTLDRFGKDVDGEIAMASFRRLLKDQSGATAIEYGLVALIISVVAVASMKTTGTSVSKNFSAVEVKVK